MGAYPAQALGDRIKIKIKIKIRIKIKIKDYDYGLRLRDWEGYKRDSFCRNCAHFSIAGPESLHPEVLPTSDWWLADQILIFSRSDVRVVAAAPLVALRLGWKRRIGL